MNNSQIEKIRLQTQLLQLKRIKKEVSEREYNQAKENLEKAMGKVMKNKSNIKTYRSGLVESEELNNKSNNLGRIICDRQYWLNYDIDKETYYLQVNEEEAEKVNIEYERAKLKMLETLKKLELAITTIKNANMADVEMDQAENRMRNNSLVSITGGLP